MQSSENLGIQKQPTNLAEMRNKMKAQKPVPNFQQQEHNIQMLKKYRTQIDSQKQEQDTSKSTTDSSINKAELL